MSTDDGQKRCLLFFLSTESGTAITRGVALTSIQAPSRHMQFVLCGSKVRNFSILTHFLRGSVLTLFVASDMPMCRSHIRLQYETHAVQLLRVQLKLPEPFFSFAHQAFWKFILLLFCNLVLPTYSSLFLIFECLFYIEITITSTINIFLMWKIDHIVHVASCCNEKNKCSFANLT